MRPEGTRAFSIFSSLLFSACGASPLVAPDVRPPDAGVPSAPDAGEPDGGAPSDDGGDRCASIALPAASADLLWLVDATGTWDRRLDRQLGVHDALADALPAWRGAEHALTIFPRLDATPACDPTAYEIPDVPFGQEAATILDTIGARANAGESPLGAALGGAIRHARAHASEHLDRAVSVVLITDATMGDDEVCEDWPELAPITAAGFDRGRAGGVHTHVVSIVAGGVSPDHGPRMEEIAAAGGGLSAVLNGGRADVRRSVGTVLGFVRDRMTTCTRTLPPGVVPERLVVTFDDGTTHAIDRVEDASACAGTGFYLDDPIAPRTATLCSGQPPSGGICELVYLQARALGAPAITADTCTP